MSQDVGIVGAGIIGMTAAIRLLEKGFKVTVYTKDDPLKTNSDAAVATWYVPDDSKPLLQKLCLESLPELEELSKIPNSGVTKIKIIHYYKDEEDFKQSAWAKEDVKKLAEVSFDLPKDYVKRDDFPFAFSTTVPLIEPSKYRPQMLEKFKALGGVIKREEVKSLEPLTYSHDIVINCAGWESKYLAHDEKVFPVRGQVEIVKLKEDVKNKSSFNVKDENSYVVYRPTSNDGALGTTYQVNDDVKTIRQSDTDGILKKVSSFISLDENAPIVSQAGIRCGRFDARLESEIFETWDGKQGLIIHGYGHGGSGYSGAAGTANRILEECLAYTHEQRLQLTR